MAPTLHQIKTAAVTEYDFINNLIRRRQLRTQIEEPSPGFAREFTRENALEISFLAALNSIGRKLSEARAVSDVWMAKEAKGELPGWWIENRATGEGRFIGTSASELTIEQLAHESMFADDIGEGEMAPDEDWTANPAEITPASRLAIIHVAEIVRRVDKLFGVDKQ